MTVAKERGKKQKKETVEQILLDEFVEVEGETLSDTNESEYQEHEEEIEEEYFVGTDGTEYTREEWESPVVFNGPSRQEIEEWKERYGSIYFTPFEDDVFVWRTLQRPEYREIIRDQTLTALDREERFTEKCILFPRNFSLDRIKNSKAGVASLLSEMIMDKSGFVAQSAPIKL